VHAIGASEIGATLEIERVNPEGEENIIGINKLHSFK